MKHNVLLIEPTIQPVGVDLIKEHCELFMAPDGGEETLIRLINEHNIEGVGTRVEQITEKIFSSCPSLKVVAQHGVGLDNIDVSAATSHGVKVLNVPDANYVSVAEHAIMFILALSRDLNTADRAVRAGNWKFRETNIPNEIAGKTLLIVALGRIGRDVAKKAQGLDMNVIAYDAYVSKEQMSEAGVEKVESLEDGLARADFVSIHAPLTDETRGMISTKQFQQMKNGACLINLGRGPLVDGKALTEALKNGEIAAAALDVFEQEPPDVTQELFRLPNFICTPHFGGDTIEAKRRCSKKLAESMIEALDGGTPYNWFNRKAMGQ